MLNLDMNVDLKVGSQSFSGNIREVLKINESNLTEEFTNQPSVYAWFAALTEIASAEVESKKLDLKILESNLNAEKRNRLSEEKGKPTEGAIQAAILTDKRYIVASQELIEVSRQHGILKSLTSALQHRKDMLIQLGSTKRQEMVLSDFGIDLKNVRRNNS